MDDFLSARDAAVRPFRFLNTIGQGTVFTLAATPVRPPGLLRTTCGGHDPLTVPDDGLVIEIHQVVPLVQMSWP